MLIATDASGTPSKYDEAFGYPWKWTVCCSNRSGRMIIPTLVSVRKNSSSSSNAASGAGMLPFITPTSMMGRGSTLPSSTGGLVAVGPTNAVCAPCPAAAASVYWKANWLDPDGDTTLLSKQVTAKVPRNCVGIGVVPTIGVGGVTPGWFGAWLIVTDWPTGMPSGSKV